jgi:hypothetical protein
LAGLSVKTFDTVHSMIALIAFWRRDVGKLHGE